MTSTRGLPVPGERDPAAYGPQLQTLAEAADRRYGTDRREDFGRVLDLMRAPSLLRRNTVAQGPFGGPGGLHMLNFPTLVFNTTGTPAPETAVLGLPTQPSRREPCWLYVGAQATATPNGAVTPASTRGLRLHVTRIDPITGNAADDTQHAIEEQEPAVAGQPTRLTIGVFVRAAAGTLSVFFEHGNTASDMTVAAGATIWATRIFPQPRFS